MVARKPELLRTAAKWIDRLDNSAVASTGVKVYRVRYGDCRQIAKLLSDLFIGGSASNLESPANQIAPGSGAANSTHLRKSNWELLKARAQENDTNVSAELRRILREEAEREAAKKSKAA